MAEHLYYSCRCSNSLEEKLEAKEANSPLAWDRHTCDKSLSSRRSEASAGWLCVRVKWEKAGCWVKEQKTAGIVSEPCEAGAARISWTFLHVSFSWAWTENMLSRSLVSHTQANNICRTVILGIPSVIPHEGVNTDEETKSRSPRHRIFCTNITNTSKIIDWLFMNKS